MLVLTDLTDCMDKQLNKKLTNEQVIYNLTLQIFYNSNAPCIDIQRSIPATSFTFLKMLQPYYKVISHFLNLACSLGWTQNHWRQISVQFSSVAQLCLTFCEAMMDFSMPGFPAHCQPPELAQTHIYQGGDAIQTSHYLPSPSPAFSLAQHQGLFQ